MVVSVRVSGPQGDETPDEYNARSEAEAHDEAENLREAERRLKNQQKRDDG
jgi:hypothetical protein